MVVRPRRPALGFGARAASCPEKASDRAVQEHLGAEGEPIGAVGRLIADSATRRTTQEDSMRSERTRGSPDSGRRTRRRRIAAVGSVLALLAISGAQAQATPSAHPLSNHRSRVMLAHPGPPPVTLSSSGITLAMTPYTSCWYDDHGGSCLDGIPPKPLPSLGGLYGPVTLSFARDGWHFTVTAVDSAGHRTKLALVRLGAREWRLPLGGLPHGHYRVDMFGQGPEGDVSAAAGFAVR